MVGAHRNLNGSRDLDHARFMNALSSVDFATINPCAKFDVSTPTRYEDIKGNRKFKMGWFVVTKNT